MYEKIDQPEECNRLDKGRCPRATRELRAELAVSFMVVLGIDAISVDQKACGRYQQRRTGQQGNVPLVKLFEHSGASVR